MNPKILAYLLAIERYGTVTSAARQLYMQQPNLSRILQESERRLGFKIFERGARGMKPSAKGEVFLRYAEHLVKETDNFNRLYPDSAAAPSLFSVACPRSSYIVYSFARFYQQSAHESGHAFSLLETDAFQTIQMVADSEVRIGIIHCVEESFHLYQHSIEARGLSYQPLFNYHGQLLLSAEHPLAKRGGRALTDGDLHDYTEIYYYDSAVPQHDGHPLRAREVGAHALRVYDRGTLFELLALVPGTYYWSSPLLPELLAKHGLVQLSCPELAPRYLDVALYPPHAQPKSLEEDFIEQLRQTTLSDFPDIRPV